MAIITAHTTFLDSINVAFATGELRTKAQLSAEFKAEYDTYAFSNYDAFDIEIKTLMSKMESDMNFVSSVYKKTLTEYLLKTKEQVEAVMIELDSAAILLDSNITKRKAQLSEIEKYRAFVADEENIAKKRNIDFGLLISYIKTTAGYLSYVLTVDPTQLTNVDQTSPLTRFKTAKDELKNALISYGYGGISGSTVLDALETLVAGMPTAIPSVPTTPVVAPVVITQDDFQYDTLSNTVTTLVASLPALDIPALELAEETVDRYFASFGIENSKRAETMLAVKDFQQKMKKSLIEMVLAGREEIRKESIGAAAKLQGYINEIEKKRNIIAMKENQLDEAEAKITAGAKDITARVAAVQNFYDNLLRQGTEVAGSYANSVVSSVPAQASSVIADFKDFLDMQQKEIDVRI